MSKSDFGHFASFCRIMVGHGAYAGVAPHVFCGLYHVDDGVDRQYGSQYGNWCSDASHEREGDEIASHRHSGVAHSSYDGDAQPQEHEGQREVPAS